VGYSTLNRHVIAGIRGVVGEDLRRGDIRKKVDLRKIEGHLREILQTGRNDGFFVRIFVIFSHHHPASVDAYRLSLSLGDAFSLLSIDV
jgi:hypothetical protein